MIIYRTLENISINELHKTFIKAFSDYEVEMNLSVFRFRDMLKKNGYINKASIGVFDDNELKGFVLTAIREYDGKLLAYDTATAVIKEYRNKGITTNMFNILKGVLKNIGVESYQLEVIQNNKAAIKTYLKQGFKVSRELNCFKLNYKPLRANNLITNRSKFTNYEWKQIKEFWDYSPSWQNSIESIKNSNEQHIYSVIILEDSIVAYGVMDKKTGDIKQVAVDKNYRGQGYGKAIVLNLVNWAESKIITILNVDAKDYSMEGFLKHIGFSDYVKQYEMVLKL